MSSYIFGALIEHESSHPSGLAPPAPVAQRGRIETGLGPTEDELDELQWGRKLNGPSGHPPVQAKSTSERVTPETPRELEQSYPPTPSEDHVVDPIMSASNPSMNKWRLAANCLMFFNHGINDSAPGALIPYMEQNYKIGCAIVSLIFITNAVGFILAAPLVQAIEHRYGRARAYMFTGSLNAAAYVTIIWRPPFPVVVVGFFFLGFGMAIKLA